ncbi:MAG: ATP phosphoribosyltransferase regulatory subunit [Snowella sp.]|nr:ATP phosphoribosyltransferase regulatory subunit [Snowella sp.]
MIHQPPAGARDLLPVEVAQKAWINNRLQDIFQGWGYQRIVTSTLEWLDTLIAGGAIEPSTVIQLQDSSAGNLGLRPELTASIARAAVTRMSDSIYPQRLCYRANVFRKPPVGYHGRQLEFYQAGVELLFVGGVMADAEMLLLMADGLKALGIPQWQVIVGEAGLTRSLLSRLTEPLQTEVRECLIDLDYVKLSNLDYPTVELKDWALQLFDLRGEAETVLETVSQLNLDSASQERIKNLKSLVEIIRQSDQSQISLILDLSWLQPFDYYTGIVFQAVSVADNQSHILGQGGRYDQLLGLYHPQKKSLPGIGFSLNIEDLHACLLPTEHLPKTTPLIDCLVIPLSTEDRSQAFRYAQSLRDAQPTLRVELELGDRGMDEIRAYARNAQIKQLAWINTEGAVKTEIIA